MGDGFGEYAEVAERGAEAGAQEAAAAAAAIGAAGAGAQEAAEATAAAASLLEAQRTFYAALTKGDAEAMGPLWDPEAEEDAFVSDVVKAPPPMPFT